MQTLGLSDSTPRSESRWRALLWPTIRNDADYDYVTHQGFWICIAVSATSLLSGLASHGDLLTVFAEAVFFFLAATGVRERSRLAAISAFVSYLFRAFLIARSGAGFGFTRIFFLVLLFTNVRGSWMCARWPRDPEPLRLRLTFADRLSDQLPPWLWHRARFVFYVFAAVELTSLAASLH